MSRDQRQDVFGSRSPRASGTVRRTGEWLPVAPGLTPHELRHTHKTLMEELGTPGERPYVPLDQRNPRELVVAGPVR